MTMSAELLHIMSEAYDKGCPYMPMPDYIHECRAYGETVRCGYDCAEDGGEYEADIEIADIEIADIDTDDPDAIKETVVSRACDSLLAKYGSRIALPTEDSAIWFDGQ